VPGWNIEREGISTVLSLLVLGNEEGELRSQLLDRFGMHAEIGTVKEPDMSSNR
jgi:magnesium chelatase subunit I